MIATIFIGLIVGVIAKLLMPGKDPGGWIITCLLGIAGAAVAHFIGVRAGMYQDTEPAGFLASVLGAVILLVIYRLLHRKTVTK
jgi:uncharacterized membrane protein YeaQ/YmgE (transglycosylase-associated protein family)